MKTFLEVRKMYDGGRAAKTGWDCGDCGAEKNRSDQCRSCGSPKRYHVKEDLASGRPAKKPVSSNLLQQRAKANTKALKSGFMKLTKQERDKEARRMSEEKKNCGCGQDPCITYGKKQMKESARDNYNPEISDKRTKEKLKKAGLPPESPKVMEARERIRDIFEGKKKGLDGKACWKGYKLQGTKKKGNKTVDDCVPVNEISDALKKRYLAKAGKQITSKEKMKDYQLGQMDKQKDKPASLPREKFTKADKEFVKNKYDKDTLKRRKGMAQARSKLGEAKKPVVHSTKPDSLKMVKIKYNKPIKTKVTDIGPGGKEVVRKDWSEDYTPSLREQQIQIVTNLDFNESLGMLVSRGMKKVQRMADNVAQKVDAYDKSTKGAMSKTYNPVSGKNIAKRINKAKASQKKRLT